MNSIILKGTLAIAFAAAAALPGLSAKADQIVTTTFTSSPVLISSKTCSTSTSFGVLAPGPGMLVTNASGQQLMVPTRMNQNQILFVTTGDTITGFTCCTPNDLITRRDDLLARIFAEKATGKLSGDQSIALIDEVQNAFAACSSLGGGDESDVDHVKAVKRIYRSFDRVSNDHYNYVVL
jgi:hypothetical protein